MRGPMVRIKSDMRRLWRCPKCGYERRAHADHTSMRCHCDDDGPFMKLIEQQRFVRPEPEELDLYFEYDESADSSTTETVESVASQSESESGEAPPTVVAETDSQVATDVPVDDQQNPDSANT